jgi:hypothetical protein
MTLGIILSFVVGCGLMTLMFYSSRHGYDEAAAVTKWDGAPMQQKTDGRVVRCLTKHLSAEDSALEQWMLWQRPSMHQTKLLRSSDTSPQLLSPVGV